MLVSLLMSSLKQSILFDLFCMVQCNPICCNSKKGCIYLIFLFNFRAFSSLLGVLCGFGDYKMVVVVTDYLLGASLVALLLALSSATPIATAVCVELESVCSSGCVWGLFVASVLFGILLII